MPMREIKRSIVECDVGVLSENAQIAEDACAPLGIELLKTDVECADGTTPPVFRIVDPQCAGQPTPREAAFEIMKASSTDSPRSTRSHSSALAWPSISGPAAEPSLCKFADARLHCWRQGRQATGQQRYSLAGPHFSVANNVVLPAVLADGRLASGGYHGKIKLWPGQRDPDSLRDKLVARGRPVPTC